MYPETDLTPHHLRSNIYVTGTRDGVDPEKVQHKYGSWDGFSDGVDHPMS